MFHYRTKTEKGIADLQEAFEKHVRFTAAIREIKMAILDMKFNVTQLQEALDVTSMGQLSSMLINPYNLSVIVQKVSLQLPAGLFILTCVAVEDMPITLLLLFILLPPKPFGCSLKYH
jgi:hypothetical protein